MGHLAVSAVGEFLPACVNPDLRGVACPVKVNDGSISKWSGIWSPAKDASNAIDNGIFDLEAREHRVVNGRMINRARHREVAIERNDVLPRNLRHANAELVGVRTRERVEAIQHPHGNARDKIEPHGIKQAALAFDSGGAALLGRDTKVFEFVCEQVTLARAARET